MSLEKPANIHLVSISLVRSLEFLRLEHLPIQRSLIHRFGVCFQCSFNFKGKYYFIIDQCGYVFKGICPAGWSK
jgi:hypothetical protein